MEDNKEKSVVINSDEAAQILASIEDLITNQLVNKANYHVIKKISVEKKFPEAAFDLKFFVDVMVEFCRDHETLRKILSGEDLRWLTESEG